MSRFFVSTNAKLLLNPIRTFKCLPTFTVQNTKNERNYNQRPQPQPARQA